jgi:hypothetical protein
MTRSFVRTVGALVLAGAAVIACGDDEPTGPDLEIEEFTATLTGAAERPTANASTATGTATITRVGPTLLFRVDVTNLVNPSAAHIHAPADTGQTAGVKVNLCGATGVPACPAGSPAGTAFSGTLATGSAAGIVGTGMSFDSLLVLLRNGNAYVNVHTSDAALGTNNTPGDLPAGELRGQIAVAP